METITQKTWYWEFIFAERMFSTLWMAILLLETTTIVVDVREGRARMC
jgi:hypothetical protein